MRSLDPTAVGIRATQLGGAVFSKSGTWRGQTLLARLRPILILESSLIPRDLLNGIKGWFEENGIADPEERAAILRKMLDHELFNPQEQSRLAVRVFGYDPSMIPAYTRFTEGMSSVEAWLFLHPHVGVALDGLKTLFLGVSAHLNDEEKGALLHSLIVGGEFSQHAGKARFAVSLFEGDQRREVVSGMFVKSSNYPNYDGQIFKAIADGLPLEEQGLLLARVTKPREDAPEYFTAFFPASLTHLATVEEKVIVLKAAFQDIAIEKAARIMKSFSRGYWGGDCVAPIAEAMLSSPDASPEMRETFWQVYRSS